MLKIYDVLPDFAEHWTLSHRCTKNNGWLSWVLLFNELELIIAVSHLHDAEYIDVYVHPILELIFLADKSNYHMAANIMLEEYVKYYRFSSGVITNDQALYFLIMCNSFLRLHSDSTRDTLKEFVTAYFKAIDQDQ